jgi:hypothetical protein
MSNAKNGNGLAELECRLWAAADQLWANSSLRPSEYSAPVLGLIFLRFPGHAKVNLVESPLGKIPPGWKAPRLDEVAAVNAASIRRGEEPQDVLYVDISSVATCRSPSCIKP